MTARAYRPWTQAEDQLLAWHYGEEPVSRTAARIERSETALRRRMLARVGSSSAAQGRTSLFQLAEQAGCYPSEIKQACREAGIKPVRMGSDKVRGRRLLFDEGQVERVLAWLDGRDEARSRTVRAIARETRSPVSSSYFAAGALGLKCGEDGALSAEHAALLRNELSERGKRARMRAQVTKLAQTIGVSTRTAYRCVRSLGIEPHADGLSPQDESMLRAALAGGTRGR